MNSATQQFIEDAIKGGWKYRGRPNVQIEVLDRDEQTTLPRPPFHLPPRIIATFDDGYVLNVNTEVILLDPLAWQATGRTRGWPKENGLKASPDGSFGTVPNPGVSWYWHTFIDHLADGKTIEEALQALN